MASREKDEYDWDGKGASHKMGKPTQPNKIGVRLRKFLADSLPSDWPSDSCIGVTLKIRLPLSEKSGSPSSAITMREMDSSIEAGKRAVETYLKIRKIEWFGRRSSIGQTCLSSDEISSIAEFPELEWVNLRRGTMRTIREGGYFETDPRKQY